MTKNIYRHTEALAEVSLLKVSNILKSYTLKQVLGDKIVGSRPNLRSYANLLLANGAPMKYVQHQLGHSSITMTMDLYTHLLPEVNDKCVNLLNSIVNQSIESQEEVQRFGT